MALIAGALVEITSLSSPVKNANDPDAAPVDLVGTRAQLIEHDREADRWIAATFNGLKISIAPKCLRELTAEDLKGYDCVLGPASDQNVIGEGLADCLSDQGYAAIKLFVSENDSQAMISAASKLEADDQFARLAVEFERGYLGIDGSGKVVHVNPDSANTPEYVKDSPLSVMDSAFNTISYMLSDREAALGFNIFSRSTMLLRKPLAAADDDKYPPADINDTDAESYMHLMVRKQITVLQFVGPSTGAVKLIPVGDDGPEITLKAEPGSMLCIHAKRYEYTLTLPNDSLVLSTFFLKEPMVYSLGDAISGDTSALFTVGGPPQPPGEQISVTGIYCRYGTNASGRHQYWCGAGVTATDALIDIPYTRWDHTPYWDPDSKFGGSYTRHACFGIEGVELFDCKFFDISPSEAKGMDPCQRQVLEVSYLAMLEGGYDKKSLQREPQNIGHWVGIDKDDWMCMCSAGMLNISGATGASAAANSITANRFSYVTNIKGASMTIDTACSSSLVCTHVAKLHLRFKDFDAMPAAVVNGINIILYTGPFIGCCAANMLSHEGRCFSFNSTADGYARGELCGAMCIKPLKMCAETIACLAGSQTNQDGRSASMTAPNGPAQERCIHAVLREVKTKPSEVDCFECHGTGTSLGDPIEVGSFKKVMSQGGRTEPLVISSSKSNIAHSEGGAGLAGFVKICLQVSHCEGSAAVHFRIRNPHLDFDGFPCQILSESVLFREIGAYSGVSSFGFGGTNAHAQAYGQDIMTSRGVVNMDPRKVFEKKLKAAPPAEITMNGDDVNDWETTGPDPHADPLASYTVNLEEDGTITWEKVDPDLMDYGSEFFIQGSFNEWEPEAMDQHTSISGLWTGEITLGSSGTESFQIIGDNDKEMAYSPAVEDCKLKATKINGPGAAAKEYAWNITGNPGDVFTIEFFIQEQNRSILWLKQ